MKGLKVTSLVFWLVGIIFVALGMFPMLRNIWIKNKYINVGGKVTATISKIDQYIDVSEKTENNVYITYTFGGFHYSAKLTSCFADMHNDQQFDIWVDPDKPTKFFIEDSNKLYILLTVAGALFSICGSCTALLSLRENWHHLADI